MHASLTGSVTAEALDAATWTDDDEGWSLDLGAATFVEPSGLVAIACFVESMPDGCVFNWTPPKRRAVDSYLSRMRLNEVVKELGVDRALVDRVGHHPNDGLLELQRYQSLDGADALAVMIDERVSPLLAEGQRQPFIEALFELSQSAPEHSGREGAYFAAQIYQPGTRSARVKFAIGDAGIGIRTSLEGTPFECDDDRAAIEAAMEQRVSRLGRNRGYGLAYTLKTINRLSGSLRVRSGDTAISFTAASPEPRATVSRCVSPPGTLVSVDLPCW